MKASEREEREGGTKGGWRDQREREGGERCKARREGEEER